MNRALTAYTTAALCALIGGWLLLSPRAPAQRATPGAAAPATRTAVAGAATTAAVTPPPQVPGAPVASARATVRPRPATASGSPVQAVPSGALAPGDGPAADSTVQELQERSSPRNLPAALEARLAHLAARVWLADVTGEGRSQWPTYFTEPGNSGYTHVRIQAAIARTTAPGHVIATVLWAGTSPAGGSEVGLTGTMHLNQQPDHTWEPVPARPKP